MLLFRRCGAVRWWFGAFVYVAGSSEDASGGGRSRARHATFTHAAQLTAKTASILAVGEKSALNKKRVHGKIEMYCIPALPIPAQISFPLHSCHMASSAVVIMTSSWYASPNHLLAFPIRQASVPTLEGCTWPAHGVNRQSKTPSPKYRPRSIGVESRNGLASQRPGARPNAVSGR